MKAHYILTEWHQALGHEATVEMVFQALDDVQSQDIIDEICQKIKTNQTLSKLHTECTY